MPEPETTFDSWCIVEIMGHRKLAGKALSPGGPGALGAMLRIDVYNGEGEDYTTQFYGPQSIFSLTPTTEEICRRLGARWHTPPPVSPWELRLPSETGGYPEDDHGDQPDLDEGDELGPF